MPRVGLRHRRSSLWLRVPWLLKHRANAGSSLSSMKEWGVPKFLGATKQCL
jgi:hypothetical protein